MSRDYSTVDAIFAKQNLFYDFCKEMAEAIAEEWACHQEDDVRGEFLDFEDAFPTLYDEAFDGMTCAEAEDAINSYGIFPAFEKYEKAYGCRPSTPQALLAFIARKKVWGRAEYLVEEQEKEEEDE